MRCGPHKHAQPHSNTRDGLCCVSTPQQPTSLLSSVGECLRGIPKFFVPPGSSTTCRLFFNTDRFSRLHSGCIHMGIGVGVCVGHQDDSLTTWVPHSRLLTGLPLLPHYATEIPRWKACVLFIHSESSPNQFENTLYETSRALDIVTVTTSPTITRRIWTKMILLAPGVTDHIRSV